MYGFAITLICLFTVNAYFIFVQCKLSKLIDFINDNNNWLNNSIPDLYYIFCLPMCNFEFAVFLYKTREPPVLIADSFPEYKYLRLLSTIALFICVGFGVITLTFIVFRHVLHRLF